MPEHGLVTGSCIQWSSPITMQPKSDNKIRFCIELRQVNALAKTDIHSDKGYRGGHLYYQSRSSQGVPADSLD